MSSVSSVVSFRAEFSAPQFLEDLGRGSKAIGAPYSEETTKAIIETFAQAFEEGAVQVGTTSRTGEALHYRLYTFRPINALDIAIKSGLVEPSDVIVQLIDSWKAAWDNAYEQLEFAVDRKAVDSVWLVGTNPIHIDRLLDSPLLPDSIKHHKATFHDLGLQIVPAITTTFQAQKFGFYFVAQGPLTKDLAARYCSLIGSPGPSKELYNDMSNTLGNDPFFLMVAIDFKTGKILEVQFYIIFPVEIRGEIPQVGERLETFYNHVDCHDAEETDILGWCFDPSPYLIAERAYCGGFRDLLRKWMLG